MRRPVTVDIDGGGFVPLFTSFVDNDGSQDYFMASGSGPFPIDDPMLMNGTPREKVRAS